MTIRESTQIDLSPGNQELYSSETWMDNPCSSSYHTVPDVGLPVGYRLVLAGCRPLKMWLHPALEPPIGGYRIQKSMKNSRYLLLTLHTMTGLDSEALPLGRG